jgi:hypothetical protein
MKLELKHLAPYLPHKLQVSINKNGWEYMISGSSNIAELRGLYGDDMCLLYQENEGFDLDFESFELILRPKTDLVKEIEINGKKFVPAFVLWPVSIKEEEDFEIYGKIPDYWKNNLNLEFENDLSYREIKYLFKWHFDVFDLHSKNLCIYYNELDN